MAAGNGIRKWQTQVSKSVKNGQMPNAFFWHLRVPIRSLERGIGKEIDIHMMYNHLWSLSSGFYTQVVRPTTSLWVQNTAKSALKSTLFA